MYGGFRSRCGARLAAAAGSLTREDDASQRDRSGGAKSEGELSNSGRRIAYSNCEEERDAMT
jgi:hypothetical protein